MAVQAAPLIAAALLRRGAGLTSGLLAGGVVGVQAVLDRGALILAKQRQETAQRPVRHRAAACAAGAVSTAIAAPSANTAPVRILFMSISLSLGAIEAGLPQPPPFA